MAFDLDNEELKATRKLHGQDDGLYEGEINKTANKIATNVGIDFSEAKAAIMQFSMSNKTIDKNVVSEDDMEELYDMLLHHRETGEVRIAIKHLLTEREQDKKRIQELEENNLHWRGKYLLALGEIGMIPKQKVKDKIEEYKEQKNKYENETQEPFSNDYYRRKGLEIAHKIDALQELLENK